MKFVYTIEVESDCSACEGPYTARMIDPEFPARPTPFEAVGETPILALAALGKVCEEWPAGGAERWLATPAGQALEDEVRFGIRQTPIFGKRGMS